ncbi:MAG TPA: hypothetical protein ENK57_10730 [Polyangiaceae bacterium]|nr:hypothetical protein [Polyangiaceae bacterium]
MMAKNINNCEREYDFALVVSGVSDLTEEVMDALFEAGCDDATPSIRYGLLYLEFSRSASTLKDAIISAIRDVLRSGLPGVKVVQVDDCNLVSQSEIARRMGRSRQLVHQYITGQRGPGAFPPPVCHLAEGKPLWQWCTVSFWLASNNLLRQEESTNAAVIEAINTALERHLLPEGLLEEVEKDLRKIGA